jgi:hypothetical protein
LLTVDANDDGHDDGHLCLTVASRPSPGIDVG